MSFEHLAPRPRSKVILCVVHVESLWTYTLCVSILNMQYMQLHTWNAQYAKAFQIWNICKNIQTYAKYAINIPNMQHMQKTSNICNICKNIPKYATKYQNMQLIDQICKIIPRSHWQWHNVSSLKNFLWKLAPRPRSKVIPCVVHVESLWTDTLCVFSICQCYICNYILGMHSMQKYTKYATYAKTYNYMQYMLKIYTYAK